MSTLADDTTIKDDEILWRRILPRQGATIDWYKYENGEWRPSSLAFLDTRSPTHSLSAYISSETELGRLRTDYQEDNIAGFAARVPRAFAYTIQRVPEAGYESHVEITPPADIWGHGNQKRKRRKEAARAMAKAAHWVYCRDCNETV